MIDGYDDNFSTTDRPIYVKPVSNPAIYITSKWLDEKKDQYANVFIDDKPLIRCKDCKYWKMNITVIPTSETDKAMYCTRYMWMTHTDADDFCSRGEKKDE